jgi:hypothetical protein
MSRPPAAVAMMVVAVTSLVGAQSQVPGRTLARRATAITIRPFALAQVVGEIAGYSVHVPSARILRVVDTRAVVVESDSPMRPTWRDRNRVLVVLENGRSLAIPRPPVATSPVTIIGVARTLLGLQAGHDVPWPEPLTRDVINRLDIRAAILASSIQTADGVELTSSVSLSP